ncbi:hypothetical protein GIB23_01325, partial [Pseudomonas putida]|nr:hypothetical protein [Pseudomonas putida]
EDKDRRFWSEVAAGALTSAAAGMELLAVGTEKVFGEFGNGSAIGRGSRISLGRYRFWGAVMASAGGLVSIWWDIDDALQVTDKLFLPRSRRNLLSSAYIARVFATSTMLAGQGGLAFAQASAYFRWRAMSRQASSVADLFNYLSGLSTRIASHQGATLLFGRMIWIGGVVVIAASVLIFILDEDALEKWCVKSCFSRIDGKRFGNNGEELSELFNAIQGVL